MNSGYDNDKNDERSYVPIADDYVFPKIKDVIAAPELKKGLEDIVLTINNPEIFSLMGVSPDKSFLFTGPPGTGKTMSAKAIRNEVQETNPRDPKPEIAWLPYNIGQVGTAYINMGAVNLQNIFDVGRSLVQNNHIVLYFFDEADVILTKRGGHHSHKEDEKILDCLMKNLQNINNYESNQYVIFATNFPGALDTAAIRAGRIDRKIHFPFPGVEELSQAYSLYVDLTNNRAQYALFGNIDFKRLAKRSIGFSYADISSVVEKTVRTKVFDVLRDEKYVYEAPTLFQADLENTIVEHFKTLQHDKKEYQIGFKTN